MPLINWQKISLSFDPKGLPFFVRNVTTIDTSKNQFPNINVVIKFKYEEGSYQPALRLLAHPQNGNFFLATRQDLRKFDFPESLLKSAFVGVLKKVTSFFSYVTVFRN